MVELSCMAWYSSGFYIICVAAQDCQMSNYKYKDKNSRANRMSVAMNSEVNGKGFSLKTRGRGEVGFIEIGRETCERTLLGTHTQEN